MESEKEETKKDEKNNVQEGRAIHMDKGNLSVEQINLMLVNLPVDITYVDENDIVKYYSANPERIFPRSPGIIGRTVQNCHPQKSVHIVNKILESFKKNDKNEAEFWLTMNGRFLYIKYIALRDNNEYKGTLEVTQDITDQRKLEGEKRLPDW